MNGINILKAIKKIYEVKLTLEHKFNLVSIVEIFLNLNLFILIGG